MLTTGEFVSPYAKHRNCIVHFVFILFLCIHEHCSLCIHVVHCAFMLFIVYSCWSLCSHIFNRVLMFFIVHLCWIKIVSVYLSLSHHHHLLRFMPIFQNLLGLSWLGPPFYPVIMLMKYKINIIDSVSLQNMKHMTRVRYDWALVQPLRISVE